MDSMLPRQGFRWFGPVGICENLFAKFIAIPINLVGVFRNGAQKIIGMEAYVTVKNQKFTFLNRSENDSRRAVEIRDSIEKFLEFKRFERRSKKTIQAYRQTLNSFAKWCGERHKNTLTSEVMHEYIRYLAEEKDPWDDHPTSPTQNRRLSPRYINNTIRILRIFCNWLVSERIITDSPMVGIRYLKESNDTFEIFTDEEVERLLSVPNRRVYTSYRDYCMMLVLLDTGCRIGELVNQKVSDYDFKLKQLTIREEISKTGTRVVPLSDYTIKELKNLISYINVGPDDYLWLTQFGERYYADSFAKMLKKYGKKAGIQNARVSPHTFRNYFAVKFLKNGGDPVALMRILGHTSYTMTERYIKYTKQDLQIFHEKASPVASLIEKGSTKKRGNIKFK